MEDRRVRKLAQYMIHHSIALGAGEKILIETHGAAKEMARALIEEAYQAGAEPFFQQYDYDLDAAIMRGSSERHMQDIAAYELRRMQDMDAYIDIRVMNNIYKWKSVPDERMEYYKKHYWGPIHLDERCNRTRWIVTHFPCDSAAQQFKMSTGDFEDFYFGACLVDYLRMAEAEKALAARICAADQVRVTGPGTDLRFSIKGIGALCQYGQSNLPDGEVSTAPVRDSVFGHISYNAPSPYDGVMFEGVRLTFERGRIVEATANNNVDRLNRILDTDEGARYIGEFAFGLNPAILDPVGDTLFDEKIAGSLHFTPGNAYDAADNGNRSAVHWDLITIQRPEYGGGEVWFDDVLIRKDGEFVPADLHPLNRDALQAKEESR